MSKIKMGQFRDSRRTEVVERQEVRNSRTVPEQLALLDERLGKGLGAKKERARLTGNR